MKKYSIKEIYLTLQGEGAQAGRAAVFLRFAGCNLWSGLEKDRPTAICRFCDTDFHGTDGPLGGKYSAEDLAATAAAVWQQAFAKSPQQQKNIMEKACIVCTGGEPLLQLDEPLLRALRQKGFEIAVETNGTLPRPPGIDWLCVSPKAHTELLLTSGNELKLVYPQQDAPPEHYAHMNFQHFFLQPMDGPQREANTRAAIAYCLKNPQWKLSVQWHKWIGIA